LVAFLNPSWGFGILLLITSTLFHLEQYVTVQLPVGYIEPTEALITAMLLHVALKRCGLSSHAGWHRPIAIRNEGESLKHAWILMGVYCLWQTLCVLSGLVQYGGIDLLRFGLRFILAAVLPWLTLYILWKLSTAERKQIFNLAYVLALLTACAHLVIQLFDWRSVMTAAYWWVPENGEQDFSWIKQWVDQNDFVRGLPQGIILIVFFAIVKFYDYAVESRRRISDLIATLLLVSAVVITFSRSLIVTLLVGLLLVMILLTQLRSSKLAAAVRIAGMLFVFVLTVVGFDALRPGFLNFWTERIGKLEGADSQIFSEENKARGLDNISSLRAIADHPVLGVGMPRYPPEYSLRSGPPTDIHPMLSIGLVGGIPAIFLVFVLQAGLFLPSLKRLVRFPHLATGVLPLVAVLLLSSFGINMIGGGGTLFGAPIMFVTIFTAELWRREANASANTGRALSDSAHSSRSNLHDQHQQSTHLHPHAIL
jgi:hypothetical protein